MASRVCSFSRLPGRYAIVRLAADAALPAALLAGPPFVSLTRTSDELSIVCAEGLVPGGARSEPGWAVLKLHGPFAFDQVGILASCVVPLAERGVSLFTVSTFDTDYIMVKGAQVADAIAALQGAGHSFVADASG